MHSQPTLRHCKKGAIIDEQIQKRQKLVAFLLSAAMVFNLIPGFSISTAAHAASISAFATANFNSHNSEWANTGMDVGTNISDGGFHFQYDNRSSTDIWGVSGSGTGVDGSAAINLGGANVEGVHTPETLTIQNVDSNVFGFVSFYLNEAGYGHGTWIVEGFLHNVSTGTQTIDTGTDTLPIGSTLGTVTLNANFSNVDKVLISSFQTGFNTVYLDDFVFAPVVTAVTSITPTKGSGAGGTPRIRLIVGGVEKYAQYYNGSGTTALKFRYSVDYGDTDSDGILVDSLSLNGGKIMDTASNDADLTLVTPDNKGIVLIFDHSGVLPSTASVTFSAKAKGFLPGQKLHFYFYNPTTGQIEPQSQHYTVDSDGMVTVQISHCSNYVLLPNLARTITLDTRSYTLSPKQSYITGVKLTGTSGAKIKAYSSTKGVADVTVLSNGNVKATGLKPGLTYIMIDVYDNKNKLLTHASVRLTVQNGVKSNGNSARQYGIF